MTENSPGRRQRSQNSTQDAVVGWRGPSRRRPPTGPEGPGRRKSPRSTARRMSDRTRSTADSVETRRSSNLESTDRLEMGRYEPASVASRPDFFMTGVINASLKPAGKRPVSRERLDSSLTNGAIKSAIRFKTYVGTGSAAEQLTAVRQLTDGINDVAGGHSYK